MDWVFLVLFFGFLFVIVALIGMLLFSLAKQGDERKNFIKSKAMSYTFTVIVGFLLIEISFTIYNASVKGIASDGINPFIFLVVISVVYFVNLLYNKRRYGS